MNNKVFIFSWVGIPILSMPLIVGAIVLFPTAFATLGVATFTSLPLILIASLTVAGIVKWKANKDEKRIKEETEKQQQQEYKKIKNQQINNDKCHEFLKQYLKVEKNKPVGDLIEQIENKRKIGSVNLEKKDQSIDTQSMNDFIIEDENNSKNIPWRKHVTVNRM